jgi:hydroxymethylpyrimidine/phosphomethylpyrimidine kinase
MAEIKKKDVEMEMEMRVALTIAGSDSGGGAGIQADLKTFQAFGVFGTSAITALTAQNTLGVEAVHVIPIDMVKRQIHAVATDLRPDAFKTGMLATREVILAIAGAIRDERLGPYVLDPVMVATSGDRLLDAGAETAIAQELLPLCTLVTPNLDEAAVLVRRPVASVNEMHEAAQALVGLGARAALVKGGHLAGDVVTDVLFDGEAFHTWRRPRLRSRKTHGTGCTLSAAITAGLANGDDLLGSVGAALDFVRRAIEQAPRLGSGSGPLNHRVPARLESVRPPVVPTIEPR